MTDRSLEDVMADLDDLLETERAALLSGDLEAIGRQLHRKENLVDNDVIKHHFTAKTDAKKKNVNHKR